MYEISVHEKGRFLFVYMAGKIPKKGDQIEKKNHQNLSYDPAIKRYNNDPITIYEVMKVTHIISSSQICAALSLKEIHLTVKALGSSYELQN